MATEPQTYRDSLAERLDAIAHEANAQGEKAVAGVLFLLLSTMMLGNERDFHASTLAFGLKQGEEIARAIAGQN